MINYLNTIKGSADFIRGKIGGEPQIAIILGSGLGGLVERFKDAVEINYSEIPGFPKTTVEGHAGKLVYGELSGKRVLAMMGRFHYYEGYDISKVVFHIRVFKRLGVENLLVTNAAGGINTDFKQGDIMLISDHISFFAPSPLRGRNIDEFGTRFPDMTNAYDKGLLEMARMSAREAGIDVVEGVYAFAQGPMFETPAEIRALRILGADAVGMSTVSEVITARHSGMKVMGISCITNMAAGITGQALNHDEVLETTKRAGEKFVSLTSKIIENWNV